jgi:hypothetical protein
LKRQKSVPVFDEPEYSVIGAALTNKVPLMARAELAKGEFNRPMMPQHHSNPKIGNQTAKRMPLPGFRQLPKC